MIRFAFCASLVFAAPPASAGSATQTDWSDGPGVPPMWVTDWDSSFGSASLVFWLDPGALTLDLLQTDLATDVDNFSDMTLVDLDGDGLLDVLASGVYCSVIWFGNTSADLPWPWHVIYDHPVTDTGLPVPGDIDGDGDQDVVLINDRDEVLWVANELPDSSWTVNPVTGTRYRMMAIDVADMDADGDMDIAGAISENEWVGWWENSDGAGTSWTEHFIDDDVWYPYWVEAADVDQDGRVDLLLADPDSDPDRARWYGNPGPPFATWPVHLINDAIDKPRQITAFEMNGQPGVELLMNSVNADEMCWFEQTAPDLWTRHQIEAGDEGVWTAYPSDIDGDGDQDVGVYQQGLSVSLYWNEGVEPWPVQRMTLYDHPGGSAVLDYDLDGQNELLVSHVYWSYADLPYLGAYELGSFEQQGTVESKVLDTQTGCDWGTISWVAVKPAGTGVGFQVASGPAYTLMRDWSDTLTAPCDLHGILVDGDRFVQYRAILHTSDPQMTPELQEVTITWDALGAGGPDGDAPWLDGPCPNPVTGVSIIRLNIVSPGGASVSVYDLSGRVSAVLADRFLEAGEHDFVLPELPDGVYMMRAVLGGETAVSRFVVLD